MTTTITEPSILKTVIKIIEAELGENWWASGDETVTDVLVGYANWREGSFFTDEEPVIVLGGWNAKRYIHHSDKDQTPLTHAENRGPRLAEALEEAGAEVVWRDEYVRCCECGKAIRTEPDCYQWVPEYLIHDDYTCSACVLLDLDGYLTGLEFLNNHEKAITFAEKSDLEKIGFEDFDPSSPHVYESGWFGGMDDKPKDVLELIEKAYPEHDAVFFIDENSQFYMKFSAMIRPKDWEPDES